MTYVECVRQMVGDRWDEFLEYLELVWFGIKGCDPTPAEKEQLPWLFRPSILEDLAEEFLAEVEEA